MRIEIGSETRLLPVLRGVVRWRAKESGLSERDADCLVMAVDEAAANVIRHTYGERKVARPALDIRAYEDRIELVLEDWVPKGSFGAGAALAHWMTFVPGGLGTFFIKSFVDEACYDEMLTRRQSSEDGQVYSQIRMPGDESTSSEHRAIYPSLTVRAKWTSTLPRSCALLCLRKFGADFPSVLVNMADVTYIDSSGIATLVEGLQLSRQTKTRFGLYGLRANARSVLELSHASTGSSTSLKASRKP